MATEFKHCGECPPFLKKQCEAKGICMLGGDKKSSKKGDKKPVKKGTYG